MNSLQARDAEGPTLRHAVTVADIRYVEMLVARLEARICSAENDAAAHRDVAAQLTVRLREAEEELLLARFQLRCWSELDAAQSESSFWAALVARRRDEERQRTISCLQDGATRVRAAADEAALTSAEQLGAVSAEVAQLREELRARDDAVKTLRMENAALRQRCKEAATSGGLVEELARRDECITRLQQRNRDLTQQLLEFLSPAPAQAVAVSGLDAAANGERRLSSCSNTHQPDHSGAPPPVAPAPSVMPLHSKVCGSGACRGEALSSSTNKLPSTAAAGTPRTLADADPLLRDLKRRLPSAFR